MVSGPSPVSSRKTASNSAGSVALAFSLTVWCAPGASLLPLLTPRLDRLWRTVAAGFLLSTAVELIQLAFPGIRRPDVNDVLANTLGTAAGYLAHRLLARRAAT